MEQFTLKASDCLAMNLKHLRERNGLGLSELGDIAGLSKQSIWNFENSQRFPSKDALASIAKAFNIEETDLFDPNFRDRYKKKGK